MKKWAVWKTILVVISSVILVGGITVGSIFLAKGNNNVIILPEDISFVLDEKLYNSNTNQFEVTDDFTLKITTETPSVTETQVELLFNGNYSESLVDGTISDGVITVPKYVYINKDFQVKLNKSILNFDGKSIESINGGISNLRAKSANNQKLPISTNIAVDVPVISITVETVDMQGKVINSITEGESFSAVAKYFPEASRYSYSDDKNTSITDKREKLAYFEPVGTTEVTFRYDNNGAYFVAGNASETNHIVGYTFKSSRVQQEIYNQFAQSATGEELYNTILSYLSSSEQDSVSNIDDPTNIKIVVASIGEFQVSQVGKLLKNINVMAKYTLSVKPDAYSNDYIGATIKNSTGSEITSLLKNVAIAFEYQVQEEFKPITEEILKVTGEKKIEINGVSYYLPDASVANPKWELYTTGAYNFRMNVVLLENSTTSENGYEIYSQDNVPINAIVYVDSKVHEELDVTWTDNSDIVMTLDYNGDTVIPATKALEGLGQIPAENIFRSGIYFAYFPNANTTITDVLDEKSYLPQRSGEYTIGNQTYTLYALRGSELSVIGTGNFEIFFASVQTNDAGQFIYDNDGKYILVQATLDSIKVKVTKTLHDGSVQELDVVTTNTTGYIYEGSNETITLTFQINSDSWEVFKEELAANQISLSVLSGEEENITDKFIIAPYELIEANKQIRYTLKANNSLNLTNAIRIGYFRLFDAFSSKEWKKPTTVSLSIYTPRVETITLESDTIDLTQNITILQTLTTDGEFETLISYINKAGQEKTLGAVQDLISLLLVQVTDQYANTTYFSQRWEYRTNNSRVITVNGQTFTFQTADNATATVYAYCGNKSTAPLNFVVTSTGVQGIKRDSSTTLGVTELLPNTTGVSSVAIEKYASASGVVDLAKLVELYTSSEMTSATKLAQGYKFIFSAVYLYSLSDEDILNIFGENGMVTVFGADTTGVGRQIDTKGLSAQKLRELLAQLTEINKITITKHFSTYHEIGLQIVDSNNTGAINIKLNLMLQTNARLEADNEVEIYAGNSQSLSGRILYNNGETEALQQRLKNKFNDYYIVSTGEICRLVSASENHDGAIGKIRDGAFIFDDFWDLEEKSYVLTINLDGVDNPYTLSYTVNFVVKRNVQVLYYNQNTYSLLDPNEAITKHFKVVRITDDSQVVENYQIGLADLENSHLKLNGDMLLPNDENPPFFLYNKQVLNENLIFSIDGNEIATLPINYNLGDTFSYSALANRIYFGDSPESAVVKAKLQTVGDVNYFLVQKATGWKLQASSQDDVYTLQINEYYINANGERIYPRAYNLPAANTISFLNSGEALRGLNDDSCYIILDILSADNKKLGTMLIPLIVSDIGMEFVNYTAKLEENTLLETALSNPDTLIEKGIYEQVRAGSKYVIASQHNFENGSFKDAIGFISPDSAALTTNVSILPTTIGNFDMLVHDKSRDENTKAWSIQLNHLSQAEEYKDAYVALKFAVSNGTYTQNFYYVLKIIADTEVKDAVYAFNSGREELGGMVNEIIGGRDGINLSEKFDSKTLHNGEERFNVVVYDKDGNKTDLGENLNYSYKVLSVTVNNIVLTNEQDYSEFVSINFVEVNGKIHMQITPRKENTMTILIKRVYDGGRDGLAVVGGEIEYKFVVNSTIRYELQYEVASAGFATEKLKVDGNNANIEIKATDASKLEGGTLNLNVKLLSKTNDGDSSTGSVLYNNLQANANIDEDILKVEYNTSNALLKLTRGEYLSENKTVSITFYTDYGFLGQLDVSLPASAEVTYKTNEALAGSSYSFSDFIDSVNVNGNILESYSIEEATVSEEQEGRGLFVFDKANSKLRLYSSISDYELNISITMNFVIGGEARSYKFIMPVLVKANISQTDGDTPVGTEISSAEKVEKTDDEAIIAGNAQSFSVDEIFKTLNAENSLVNHDVKFSWYAISGVEYIEKQEEPSLDHAIMTKDVNKEGARVEVLITVYLYKGDENYQSFYVRFSFKINPNTTIAINYPNPTSEGVQYVTISVGGEKVYLNVLDGKLKNGQYIFDGAPYYSNTLCTELKGSLRGEMTSSDKPRTAYADNSDWTCEYIKDGTIYDWAGTPDKASHGSFFEGDTTFGNQRVILEKVQGADKDLSLSYNATIVEMQNLTISSSDGYHTDEDGRNVLVGKAINDKIMNVQNLRFKIGVIDNYTWPAGTKIYQKSGSNYVEISGYTLDSELVKSVSSVPDNSEYFEYSSGRYLKRTDGEVFKNDGTESYVIFLIECNGVTDTYKVIVKENVLSLAINKANVDENNTEHFYIDRIDNPSIFAPNRIVNLTINNKTQNDNIENIIAGEYRIIFGDGNIQKSLNLKLTTNDIGKTFNFDLGESFLKYKYLGTYAVSEENFDNDGKLKADAVSISDEEYFASKPEIGSRIQLTYMGHIVNYNMTNKGLTFTSVYEPEDDTNTRPTPKYSLIEYVLEQDENNLGVIAEIKGFEYSLNNGQQNLATKFGVTYNYTTDIDIDVKDSGPDTLKVVYANQEISSLIEENKIYHPSTNEALTYDEISDNNIRIRLQMVGVDKEYNADDKIIQAFENKVVREGGNAEDIATPEVDGHRFLGISAVTKSDNSNVILDYRFTGYGANNKGNYVLLYFTYSKEVNSILYSKEFYILYKVLPDYNINYLSTSNIDIDENNIWSNKSAPSSFYTNGDTFADINVAGDASGSNLVTVKHAYSKTPDRDVAASGFTYELELDKQEGDKTYNITENITAKLNDNLTGDNGWKRISDSDKVIYQWLYSATGQVLTFTNVPKIIFANQDYKLRATDSYGYVFDVYFVLNSDGSIPSALEDGTFSLTEGGKFDIAAVYESLKIEKVGKGSQDKTLLDISSISNSNVNGNDYVVLNIANLKAWGFEYPNPEDNDNKGDPFIDPEDSSKRMLNENAGVGYNVNNDFYELYESTDEKYLRKPEFANITVTQIDWRRISENDQASVSVANVKLENQTLATSSNVTYTGAQMRDTGSDGDTNYTITMPKLAGWVYGASSAVELSMVITLKYYGGGNNVEVFNLPVRMNVNRASAFEAKLNNVVCDGEEFTVNDYINAYDINKPTTEDRTIAPTYLDDTLKITLPANSQITYKVEMIKGEKVQLSSGDLISSNENYNYARTNNLSLSTLLGTTLEANASIRVTVSAFGSRKITNTGHTGFIIEYTGSGNGYVEPQFTLFGETYGTTVKDTFTISALKSDDGKFKDKINIPMAEQLYDGPVQVTKYYLAQIQENSISYNYRVPVTYNVTGYYYSFSSNYAGPYSLVEDYDEQDGSYIVKFAQWAAGMTLNRAKNSEAGLVVDENKRLDIGTLTDSDLDKIKSLKFVITDQSSSGAASIDEYGKITTTSAFNIKTHYITIAIYQKVASFDGSFGHENVYDYPLGTVTIMLKEKS